MEYAGAVYQIRSRVDWRESVFQDETDGHRYLESWGEPVSRPICWCRLIAFYAIIFIS